MKQASHTVCKHRKTANQKKCKNLQMRENEIDRGCQAAEVIGILEGTTEEIFDLRKCPYDGDTQRCLDDLIELNEQGILWQEIPHGKNWFDDPEQVKRYIEETNAVMMQDIAEAKKKGLTVSGGVDIASTERILEARRKANPSSARVKTPPIKDVLNDTIKKMQEDNETKGTRKRKK
jgi:hypothetical protein